MIFADDIMAGVGGISDIGGMIKSFASKLARAERFVLDRQVIEAAKQLAKSNPRSLVSALPLCRAPYATTWFEWTDATGNAGVRTGSDVNSVSLKDVDHLRYVRPVRRPLPGRVARIPWSRNPYGQKTEPAAGTSRRLSIWHCHVSALEAFWGSDEAC